MTHEIINTLNKIVQIKILLSKNNNNCLLDLIVTISRKLIMFNKSLNIKPYKKNIKWFFIRFK